LPKEEHIYEIGSVTKTFTTSLLCKAISEGRISLDDSIDKYLSLQKRDYYPTIRRLMTHTSGYKGYYFEKPMISNFLHKQNDFNGISEEMLLKRLGKISLDDSDYSFKYSNFGMATLGAVLEQIYDKDYTPLMNDYISEDLGLKNTKISDGSGDLNNYWKWSESDAYMPAGALLSNITDIMQYAQIQMGEAPDYLSIAHEVLAQVNSTTGSNEKIGIRIDAVVAGWMIDNENNIVWHNGATGDYNSYIGLDKENQIGVVILSNLQPDYRIPATVMGIEILTSLQK
jgi:CubicO group peptidase (beta-lactamase class C family)